RRLAQYTCSLPAHFRRPSDPLSRRLSQLALLARIRGDSLEERTLLRARTLVEAKQIGADGDLGVFLESPPPGTDAEVLKRLRFMFEAGAWVLFESVVAD